MDFEASQKAYYLSELNRAMPGNPANTDAQTIAAVLGGGGVTDLQVPADVNRLVSDFGAKSPTIQRDAACRAIRDPSQIRGNPDDRTGCGWYFRPNPLTPSSAAFGTRRGPMARNLEAAGIGEWIWDPEEAAEREARKQNARVASCADLAYTQYPNMGWCVPTNRAIVTDGHGQPRFPRSAGGDCPEGGIVTNPAACPPPVPPENGATRSSWSSAGGVSISDLCRPTGTGALTPGCIQALTSQTCSPSGLLAQSLAGSEYAAQSRDFNSINHVLVQRGFQLPAGILNDGQITTNAVMSAVGGLRQMADANDGSRETLAASRMCYGTPFNACDMKDTDSGPFDPYCITDTAMRQGWSPAGDLLRNATDYWKQFPNWATIKEKMNFWKSTADNTEPADEVLHRKAINNVYGLGVRLPTPSCNVAGVVVHRYSSPSNFSDGMMPPNGAIQTHFLGRYIFKNGLPTHGGTLEDQTPAGSYMKEVQRMMTYFSPNQDGNYQFMIMTSNWVRMYVNDQILGEVRGNPTGAVLPILPMSSTKSYKLTWDFANKEGVWSFHCQISVNGGGWTQLPGEQLQMPVDRRKPLLEYAFHKMPTTPSSYRAITDTQHILDNMVIRAPIGQLEGRQCMIVDSQQGHGVRQGGTWGQGIRAYALKSYTAMLNISSMRAPNGVTPNIFGYYNTNSANPDVMQGPKNDSSLYSNQRELLSMTTSGNNIYAWGKSASDPAVEKCYWNQNVQMPTSQWFHLAWVWDVDLTGYSIWINGNKRLHVSTPATLASSQIMEQIRVGLDEIGDGTVWTGGMAWFRGFDYQLTAADVQRDMQDDWGSL